MYGVCVRGGEESGEEREGFSATAHLCCVNCEVRGHHRSCR
jgi:RNA polymerase-binding transcription factor DksA